MWSVSVHMCRLNQRHNLLLVLFFWSSLLYFSNSGAVAAVSDFEIQPSNDIDQELLLTREEKLAFDKVGREIVMHGFLLHFNCITNNTLYKCASLYLFQII